MASREKPRSQASGVTPDEQASMVALVEVFRDIFISQRQQSPTRLSLVSRDSTLTHWVNCSCNEH